MKIFGFISFLTIFISAITAKSAKADDVIFFTNYSAGTIERVNANGTGRQTVISGLTNPSAIGIDPINGLIFWSDSTGGTHRIAKANLDGTNTAQVISLPSDNVTGIALDGASQDVYWVDQIDGSTNRCTYSGANNIEFVNGAVGLYGISLNLGQNLIYACGIAANYFSDIDTPAYYQFGFSSNGQISGISIDPIISPPRLFFADAVSVYAAEADGSNQITIVNSGVTQLNGLEASPSTQKLFFSDLGSHEIYSSDYTGGNFTTVLTGAGDPVDLAVLYQSPTPTATSTATNTATFTPSNTPTSTPTLTPTQTPTTTPTLTPTPIGELSSEAPTPKIKVKNRTVEITLRERKGVNYLRDHFVYFRAKSKIIKKIKIEVINLVGKTTIKNFPTGTFEAFTVVPRSKESKLISSKVRIFSVGNLT